MSKAVVIDGWEIHLVGDRLFITSEADPDIQVALSPQAVKGLIEYVSFKQVVGIEQRETGDT